MKKRLTQKKSGSAMLMVIVILLLIMMLSTSMLLIAYSLYQTSAKQDNLMQCRELTRTLEDRITADITKEISVEMLENESALQSYLKANINTKSWKKYNGKNQEDAYRYFNLQSNSADSKAIELMNDVEVLMYWESMEVANESSGEDGEDDATKRAVVLTVQITCKKGDQENISTSQYQWADNNDGTDGKHWEVYEE